MSTTIYLTRKKFIYSGRYLKADHFGNKMDGGAGHSKLLKWGVPKTNYVKLELQTPNFHKALYRPWEWIIDTGHHSEKKFK